MAVPILSDAEQNHSQECRMRFEVIRIGTFATWPEYNNTRPFMLAQAGFFFTGKNGSDEVTCFSCNKSLSQWKERKDPLEEHRRLSPNCSFVNQGAGINPGDRNVNIPLSVPDTEMSLQGAFSVLGNHKITSEIEDTKQTEQALAKGAPMQDTGKELNTVHIGQGTSNHQLPSLPSSAIKNPTTQAAQNSSSPLCPVSTEQGNTSLQEITDRVSSTHKHSQPNPQPNSTDPRKKADFNFMDHMRSEKERKNTFYDWPEGAWQSPTALATAGFFYTGSADRCQCAFCRLLLRNWEPNDVPIVEHKRHNTECPFVNGRNVGNMPLQPSRPEQFTNSVPSISEQSGNGLGIMTQRPKSPHFGAELARLKTFENGLWPTQQTRQSPVHLSKAGFYYTGVSDHVKCFFCDGGLRNWEPQDIPWEEHAKWFPRCPYVRMTKGDAFIQQILQAHQTQAAPPSFENGIASHNTPSAVTYRIEPKEIKARMDTATVKRVVAMGYSSETIKKVIEERLRTTGDDFSDAKSLLEAIFAMEERLNLERQEQQSNGVQQHNSPSHAMNGPGEETHEQPGATVSTVQGKSKKKRKNRNKKNKNEQPATTKEENAATHDEKLTKPGSDDEIPFEGKEALQNISSEYQKLIEQNKEMKEQRICKVCMDNEINLVFLPCAHLVCCSSCAPALKNCPICRRIIKGTVRVFLS